MVRIIWVCREAIDILWRGFKNCGADGFKILCSGVFDPTAKFNCTEKLFVTNKDPFIYLRELEGETFSDPDEAKDRQLKAALKCMKEWDDGVLYAQKNL